MANEKENVVLEDEPTAVEEKTEKVTEEVKEQKS